MTKISNVKSFDHLKIRILEFVSSFDIRISNLLFYLIILFLPTQLGKHFWPSWSYVSGLRVDYLSPTLYFTDVVIVLLIFLWSVSVIKTTNLLNPNTKARNPKQAQMTKISNVKSFDHLKIRILEFVSSFDIRISNLSSWQKYVTPMVIVLLLLGIAQSKNPMAGFYGLLKLTEFIFFGWYTARFIKNKKDFGVLVLIFSLGVCLESLLAIAQYINQSSIGGIFYFFGERTFTITTPGIANASIDGRLILRPYATFPHPNVLAGYLVIAMTFIIYHLPFTVYRFKKYFFIFSLIVGSIALLITLSRVAILLWMLVLIVCFFKFLEKRNHKSSIINRQSFIGLLVVLVCIGSIVIFPFSSRFFNVAPTDESVVRRIELMNTSVVMVKDHPFFGVGIYNFLSNLPDYQKNNTVSLFSSIQPVHNVFFLVASETGIIGLLGALVFLGKTMSYLRKKKEFLIFPSARAQGEGNFQFLILVIVLILGLFDHYFLTLQQGQLLFAFVIGLCWSKHLHGV